MALTSDSIVLDNPPPDLELRERLAHVLGWQVKPRTGQFFTYERTFEREPGVVVHTFWDPLNVTFDLRLVCDDRMGARYVDVKLPDPDKRRAILDELAKHLPVVPAAALKDGVRNGGGEGAWLRMALGVGAAFDREALDLVREGLASPVPDRRRGAAQAAALLEWPQLKEPVQEALGAELDPDVRPLLELAAQVLGVGS